MFDTMYRMMERHQRLDERLRRAVSRKVPDQFEILRLKRLKLAIKDRLNRLMHRRSDRLIMG